MAIQIGDEPERKTLAEKLAPWLRRFIIGGALLWICFSMQTFYEDARSHAIKVVYPLLLSREKITLPGTNYDPVKAVWKPVDTGFPVQDGTILFVQTGSSVYAVKLLHQTIKPEAVTYAWLKVGSTDPIVTGISQTQPGGIKLPEYSVGWGGRSDGSGYLYLDDAFIWNQPPRYTIGVPFQSGDLESLRHAVPAEVHFETLPWKINPPGADPIAPL